MAGRTKSKAKANEAVEAARPYVKRIVEDEDLRENLREVYESGKKAYERASSSKRPAELLDDKKLQHELKDASDALKSVTDALREPEKRKCGKPSFGKLLFIALIGAILALVLSEGLRKALLDQLFGAEEEFEYTTTTSPPPAS